MTFQQEKRLTDWLKIFGVWGGSLAICFTIGTTYGTIDTTIKEHEKRLNQQDKRISDLSVKVDALWYPEKSLKDK